MSECSPEPQPLYQATRVYSRPSPNTVEPLPLFCNINRNLLLTPGLCPLLPWVTLLSCLVEQVIFHSMG